MAGTQPTKGANGPLSSPWNVLNQAVGANRNLAGAMALQTQNVILDQYQNGVLIIGSLNQVVTVGAGWFSPTATLSTTSQTLTSVSSTEGIQIGMAIGGNGIPPNTTVTSVGTSTLGISAKPTSSGSETVYVGPCGGVEVGTGLSGFGLCYPTAFWSGEVTITSIPESPTAQQATVSSASGLSVGMQIGAGLLLADGTDDIYIPPGASITAISGDTITLSCYATQTGSGIYACAVTWTALPSISVAA